MQNEEELVKELQEILKFKYFISYGDLYKSKFPYNKVLQTVWGYEGTKANVAQVHMEFKDYIATNLRSFAKMGIVELNCTIYSKVDEIKNAHPECFEEVGYYTRKMLAEYYLQGRLLVDGVAVTPQEIEVRDNALRDKITAYVEEKHRLAEEEKEREYEEYVALLEKYQDDHRPVYEGCMFRNKDELIKAYKDIADKGNQAERLAKIREYIEIEYTGKGWLVQKLLKEDKMYRLPPPYPMPTYRRYW